MYITKGSDAILQIVGSASAVDEEATPRFGSPDVEYRLTNYLTYVSRFERAAWHQFLGYADAV